MLGFGGVLGYRLAKDEALAGIGRTRRRRQGRP
jgi:hypothetical protein